MGDSVTESKILWLSTKGQEKGVKFELVSFGGVERTQVSIRYSFVYMASLSQGLARKYKSRLPLCVFYILFLQTVNIFQK